MDIGFKKENILGNKRVWSGREEEDDLYGDL